jgi:hypothetical protein
MNSAMERDVWHLEQCLGYLEASKPELFSDEDNEGLVKARDRLSKLIKRNLG